MFIGNKSNKQTTDKEGSETCKLVVNGVVMWSTSGWFISYLAAIKQNYNHFIVKGVALLTATGTLIM